MKPIRKCRIYAAAMPYLTWRHSTQSGTQQAFTRRCLQAMSHQLNVPDPPDSDEEPSTWFALLHSSAN